MKPISYFLFAFLLIAVLPACQKIQDTNPDGISMGTLKKTVTGDCMAVVVSGIFIVDSILKNDNYVDVEVDVTQAGTFDIKSDSVNGYSFIKKGTLATGLNKIRLYASGKPLAAGVNTFTISYGLSTCSFKITVFTGGSAGSAQFTLGGSPGNCSVSSINGNYIVGQALTAANTIEMTVNVTTIGTYNITGTVINGVSFNVSGAFTNPGIQNIFLTATGTPTAAGVFTYTVTNNTTSCNFSITYTVTITNASFGLSGSPGNCTGATVSGTYTAGTPLNATNTVLINVNVTSPGIYTITTTAVNGISFSASGTFNITGLQQVTLKGIGTPTAAGVFNFPVSGNGNTCGISVTCM